MLSNLDPSLVSARPRTRITGDLGRPVPHWVWEYLCASFSPDGRYVVTGSIDNSARVWDVATGRLVGRPLVHDNWVRTVAFAPNSRQVLTGSHDMTARLWDIDTGEAVGPRLRHEGGVVSVAVSPDGTRALTGGGDKTARLWHLPTGEAIGLPMPHEAEVLSVCFSHNGAFALTAAASGEVRLWDAATALPIGPPARHDRPATSVRFADDDRSFLTSVRRRRRAAMARAATHCRRSRHWSRCGCKRLPARRKTPAKRSRCWTPPLGVSGELQNHGKPARGGPRQERRMQSSPGMTARPAANEFSGMGEPAYWHLDQLIDSQSTGLVAPRPAGRGLAPPRARRRSAEGA